MQQTQWNGLPNDEIEVLGLGYESACHKAVYAAFEKHPDNEQAAIQTLMLLKRGICIGIRDMIIEAGCPANEATEWTARVIRWVVENRELHGADDVVVTVH